LAYSIQIRSRDAAATDSLRIYFDETLLAEYSAADALTFAHYTRVAHDLPPDAEAGEQTLRLVCET